MKILLIQPGFGQGLGFQRTALVEPLGLEMVASSLLERGHEVRILDLRIEKNLEKTVRNFAPSLCGISCSFTIDVYQALRIAESVKKFTREAFVIIGGHHASLNPSDFSHPSIDAVVLGEGEVTACELAAALEDGRDLGDVPGLALHEERGQKITGQRETVKNLDTLPFLARHLIRKHARRYYLGFQRPLAVVETSRGCPHRCEFCSVWNFYRGQCRMKSPERVVEEVAHIKTRCLLFTDDNFLLSIPRAKRVAELLLERGIRKHIIFQARSDAIVEHPEIISLWEKVGLWKVFIGFEKVEDSELSALKKGNTVKNNEEALKILRDHKIEVCASFIVDPQYERSDFERLSHYIRQWKLYSPSITVLTPLPGTELFRRVKEKLTTQNLELFDLVHAVLPTRLSLAEFYREFCELYKIGYLHMGLGWEGLSALIRRLGSFPQVLKLMHSAWVMGDEAYYLAGHKESFR
jgi:radical SAM superfamily enzyme YgiQ (UPF0313 family)